MERDNDDCSENIYSNSDADIFNQLLISGTVLGNVRNNYDLQECASVSDESNSDFSSNEEVDDEEVEQREDCYPVVERQPVQDASAQDYHIKGRAPYPIPRNQSKGNDGIYLDPIEVRRPLNTPGLPDKGFQRTQCSPPPTLPFIGTKGPKTTKNPNCQISGDPQTPPQKLKKPTWSSSPGSNNSPAGASENGIGGAIGSSFLHRPHQESKNTTLSKIPKPWEPTWTVTPSQEKNDHEYEYVANPSASCGGPRIPGPAVLDWQSSIRPPLPPSRNQNQDFDDHDLSNRLGAATLSHNKQPPVSRKHSGGTDSGSENPPNEFAPSLPYVSLDNEKHLKLTPLYQKLMEKSFFHLVSRSKAKSLIMCGQDGMFLIRPSTRSGDPLTLVLSLENHLYNINIRQRPDSLFALGKEKVQEKAFSSLDELVNTYSREAIKLENGKMAFLKCTPPKTVPLASLLDVRK